MRTKDFKRVYVWELPVRIFHWVNVLCILILGATGFMIADPPPIMSTAEASESFWFGTVRAIHFGAAYVFFFNMLMRIYWSFVGNRFASWKQFLPFTKKAWHNFIHVVKIDMLLQNEKKFDLTNVSVGHNSVAAFSYLVLFFLALVQVFTGFGLYADNSGWWLPKLFAWVPGFLGGDFITRTIHHVTTWLFILFTMVHVYLVFYHDWLEGRGEVSSMFGGYKFVRDERVKKAEEKTQSDTEEESALEQC